MENYVHNSKLGGLIGFIRKIGLRQVFMKPIRMIFAPFIVFLKKKEKFIFEGKEYFLFYHRYNYTWLRERSVEIPIIKNSIDNCKGEILEIGNVLSHYYPLKWDVVDKYEKGNNVVNEDIIHFKPEKKYDLIVSISTFEHIGYDDNSETSSKDKIIAAFNNTIKNSLKSPGKLIITAPIDYNPDMDYIIFNNLLGFTKQNFLKKVSKTKWVEVSKKEAMQSKFGKPFPFANCVFFGTYEKSK